MNGWLFTFDAAAANRYEPSKLATPGFLEGVIAKYGGAQETKLIAAMVQKYGPEPTPPAGGPSSLLGLEKSSASAAAAVPVERSASPARAASEEPEARAEDSRFGDGESACEALVLRAASACMRARLAAARERAADRRHARRRAGGADPADGSAALAAASGEEAGATADSFAAALAAAARRRDAHAAGRHESRAARAAVRAKVLAQVDDQLESLFHDGSLSARGVGNLNLCD
jgi:hypothetical protein